MASTADQVAQVIKSFGGRRTFGERSECPPGMSPNCSDVMFGIDAVRSRPGQRARFLPPSGINSFYSFTSIERARRLIAMENIGNLAMEGPEGQGIILRGSLGPGLMMKATYAFNRVWMCFSDGQRPLDYPYQFDPAYKTSDWPNGTPIAATPAGPAIETISASMVAGGNLSAGDYYFFLTYEDRYGFITGVSPVGHVVATAGQKINFTNVTLGPVYGTSSQRVGATSKRRFWFSQVETAGEPVGPFYNISALNLDNTTTNPTIDFSDATLIDGEIWDPYLTQIPIPPALGVMSYSNRLAFWGVYGGVPSRLDYNAASAVGATDDLLGLPSYDFGALRVANGTAASVTNKWTTAVAGTQSVAIVEGNANASGTRNLVAMEFKGDGVNAGPGLVATWFAAKRSLFSSPRFWVAPGKQVGLLIRMRKLSGWATGNLTVQLETSGPNVVMTTKNFAPADVSTNWAVYAIEGSLPMPDTATPTTNVLLRVFWAGISDSGFLIDVDWIRPYPQEAKFDGSTLWWTQFGQPEAIDLIAGPLPINAGDGEEIRCVFQQNGNTYVVKERSLWVTTDNGQDPSSWNVDQVSPLVGTPSFNGVGLGSDFAVIASRDGVYWFDSGKLDKISQEIQPDWDSIDWTQGHLIWVVADPRLKQIRIGVPLASTSGVCSQVFYCDYAEGLGDGTGQNGHGRKWSIDNIKTSCGEYALKDNMTQRVVYGGRRTSSNDVTVSFASGSWVQIGTAPFSIIANRTDPFGGTGAVRWYWNNSGVLPVGAILTLGSTIPIGGYLFVAFWAKKVLVTNPDITVVIGDPSGLGQDVTVTVTSTWQRFTAVFGPMTAVTSKIMNLNLGLENYQDIDLFGAQMHAGQFDTGYVPNGLTEAGFISEAADDIGGTPGWQTSDWDGLISPTYEIAPVAMEIGRSNVGRVVARVRGGGDLTGAYVLPDGTTSPLNAGTAPTLVGNPVHDVEFNGTQEGTFVGVRLTMSHVLAWFSLKRLGVFMKAKEAIALRGKN